MSDTTIANLLTEQDATGLGALVSQGEITPLELTEAAIARIEAANPALNAVIHKSFDKALDAAQSPDLPDGPFTGVPMLLKDLWAANSAGDPNCLGTRGLRRTPFIHSADSNIVSLYRQAGFVIAGRTNTPEFGLMPTTEPLAFGPTRNPWNTDYGAGGSSGGAAAAVAAGMVPAAHASDGGGSIRIPAAMCGLVGLKPSRGRVTMDATINASGFSVQHVVCRTVRDSAAILDVSAKNFPDDNFTLPPSEQPFSKAVGSDPGSLRIGLLDTSPRPVVELHPQCAEAARKTAGLLEELGHKVELAGPQELVTDEATVAFGILWSTGAAVDMAVLSERLGREVTEEDVEPATWRMAQQGADLSEQDVQFAQDTLAQYSQNCLSWWDSGFDLLLTPTTALPPPRIGDLAALHEDPFQGLPKAIPYATFTAPFNITGQPAISLPMHFTPEGLPVGAQLVDNLGREDLLLAVAAQLEYAAPWSGQTPSL